jgi:hypothetical protein
MDYTSEHCSCLRAHDGTDEAPLEILAGVRSQCPALYEVFLPDEVWPDFQNWHRQDDNIAPHRSILLLALQRGHLRQATSAVHRYFIHAGSIRQDVRRQYLNDLRERWMHYSDPIARHRNFRIFSGRLTELQCAEWLEVQGWSISGLEALRDGPDIEGSASGSVVTAFEVKCIGTEDSDFAMVLNSLADRSAVTCVSPYAAANYLLFRAYEAGKQLAHRSGGRIAIVVVADETWWRFDVQLRNAWIDWASPQFLGGDQGWAEFLRRQRPRYPDLRADVRAVIAGLDAVWILRRSAGYRYYLEHEILIRSA